jgi:hypothetical protein
MTSVALLFKCRYSSKYYGLIRPLCVRATYLSTLSRSGWKLLNISSICDLFAEACQSVT